ncbi:PRSR2 protein, partial [Polyodon spathula]|nr:PRSR2 protein [Polyodon spathula]
MIEDCSLFNLRRLIWTETPQIYQVTKIVFVILFLQEDDALKSLTHEEKECLMFFEETIDSLETCLEKQDLCSGDSTAVNDRSTPTFIEERAPSPNAEIIDLVQINPAQAEYGNTINHSPLPVEKIYTKQRDEFKLKQEITENDHPLDYYPPPPPMVTSPNRDRPLPDTLTDHSQHSFAFFPPIGSIPTPVVIAQKIAERQAGNGNTSPNSIQYDRRRSFERDKSPPLSADDLGKLGTVPKPGRFPSNIIILGSGKECNQTISKASVNVQERKVQMLANLTGAPHFSPELEEIAMRKAPNRRLSFRDPAPEQTRTEALSKLGLMKEKNVTDDHRQTGYNSIFVKPGQVLTSKTQTVSNEPQRALPAYSGVKSVTFEPNSRSTGMFSHHNGSKSFSGNKSSFLDIKRTCSMPTTSGFRPQGVTVQFSGRGSTDESRREALRKLGLLK